MVILRKLLLSSDRTLSKTVNWVLLALRLVLGGTFFTHGWAKWDNFTAMAESFPDPLGVGSFTSLVLAIFAEAVCSLGVCMGFLHRLALIPMIFTMGIAFFVIHGGDPFAAKELSFVYLIVFGVLLVTGPGRYSVDYLFLSKAQNRNNN